MFYVKMFSDNGWEQLKDTRFDVLDRAIAFCEEVVKGPYVITCGDVVIHLGGEPISPKKRLQFILAEEGAEVIDWPLYSDGSLEPGPIHALRTLSESNVEKFEVEARDWVRSINAKPYAVNSCVVNQLNGCCSNIFYWFYYEDEKRKD